MKNVPPLTALALSCLMLLGGVEVFADWPQWRGPTRDGVVAGAAWPETLDGDALQRVWRAGLAEGYPGPIIAGGKVFTVETRNEQDEVVRAFNRLTGEPLWERAWPGAMKVPGFARRNGSWIKSTPATDGERLYVAGMLDELVCLNNEDGRIVWRVDFKERYGTNNPAFGVSTSPLIDGQFVYIQAGLSVCKLDKMTGETVWRVLADEREMMGGAFSSPIIAEVAGKRQLVVQTRMELCGVDLDTGEVLWRQAIMAFRGMNILTPTVAEDGQHIFTASYGGGSFMLRVTQDNGTFTVEQAWRNDVQGYMSNPALIDGHLYLHRRDKKVSCIEAATGEVQWTTDQSFGEYWSVAQQGDRILALDQDGTLMLIQTSPDAPMSILSQRKLTDQETWGHLALVGDLLYVREQNAISVYRWSE